ncbi:MAG: aldehyde dehydrogenase family protein, partial [Rhodococcus sp.]|nr:aldehyde dehydrogenase family protein [Rhodococcus sp. (in: high G+C Gram-positive bacteria)]
MESPAAEAYRRHTNRPPHGRRCRVTDSDAGFDPSSLRPSLFIDGQWQGAGDGGTRDIVDPSNGSVVAVVDEATPDDALAAVAAARAAFDDGPWRTVTVGERS